MTKSVKLTGEERAGAKPLPMFIRELRDAIRAGRKTMTRRVIMPQPDELGNTKSQPAYKKGDLCYLREPLVKAPAGILHYQDDDLIVLNANGGPIYWTWKRNSLSQMLMPRVVARSFARITAVRVEMVQEITEADAMAEGIKDGGDGPSGEFKILWDSINGKREKGRFAWQANPGVWVYEFAMVE